MDPNIFSREKNPKLNTAEDTCSSAVTDIVPAVTQDGDSLKHFSDISSASYQSLLDKVTITKVDPHIVYWDSKKSNDLCSTLKRILHYFKSPMECEYFRDRQTLRYLRGLIRNVDGSALIHDDCLRDSCDKDFNIVRLYATFVHSYLAEIEDNEDLVNINCHKVLLRNALSNSTHITGDIAILYLYGLIAYANFDGNKSTLLELEVLPFIQKCLSQAIKLQDDLHHDILSAALNLLWSLCFASRKTEQSQFVEEKLPKLQLISEELKHMVEGIRWTLTLPPIANQLLSESTPTPTLWLMYPTHLDVQLLPLVEAFSAKGIPFKRLTGNDSCNVARSACNTKNALILPLCQSVNWSPWCRQVVEYGYPKGVRFFLISLQESFRVEGWLGSCFPTIIYLTLHKDNASHIAEELNRWWTDLQQQEQETKE